MSQRLQYSQHALQRLGERGILRPWVEAVVKTHPRVYGHTRVFTLSATELAGRFGEVFPDGLRVVVDDRRCRVVTAHWLKGGAA